jgi:hypothetical protein
VKILKDHKFWAGVVAGVVLLAFFPQLNPRLMLAKPKQA